LGGGRLLPGRARGSSHVHPAQGGHRAGRCDAGDHLRQRRQPRRRRAGPDRARRAGPVGGGGQPRAELRLTGGLQQWDEAGHRGRGGAAGRRPPGPTRAHPRLRRPLARGPRRGLRDPGEARGDALPPGRLQGLLLAVPATELRPRPPRRRGLLPHRPQGGHGPQRDGGARSFRPRLASLGGVQAGRSSLRPAGADVREDHQQPLQEHRLGEEGHLLVLLRPPGADLPPGVLRHPAVAGGHRLLPGAVLPEAHRAQRVHDPPGGGALPREHPAALPEHHRRLPGAGLRGGEAATALRRPVGAQRPPGRVVQESFQPPPNRPDDRGLRTALERAARRVLDLPVRTVAKAVSAWLPRRTGQVLEVGCGLQPYRRYLPPEVGYVGLDWAGAGEGFGYSVPDVVHYDGGRFPFDDGRFDSVFHTEVLEHVFDVRTLLSECRRVLRPGGEMLLTVPFQARFHYIPHDYWRFTPSALRRMLEEAGFEEIDVRPRGTDVTVAGYKGVGVAYRLLSG